MNVVLEINYGQERKYTCGGKKCEGQGIDEKECNHFEEVKMELEEFKAQYFYQEAEINRLKDKMCKNVICENGSQCIEGDCQIPSLFGTGPTTQSGKLIMN